jgi:hypothetical protein
MDTRPKSTENSSELDQGFVPSRHEDVASGNCRNLRNPTVGLVSIQHDLVVIKAHLLILPAR